MNMIIKSLLVFSVPFLLLACTPDVSVKNHSIDKNVRVIVDCNITIAKLNAARAREHIFKEGESTRQESAIQMKALEAERLACKKYIAGNGTGGIPLMDDWWPETDA